MWTVETQYLSAERKAVTGNCIIYGQGGEYIATVPDKVAGLIVEAPAMAEALRRILQWINAGCDPSRKSLENARAILSRIDGAGDTLPDAPVPGVWRIVQYDPAGDVTLYWSNANGWGGLARSDGYSQAERETLNLPMGGQWWFDRDDDSDLPAPAPTGEEPYALKAARGYASNPEKWNPPSPEQMAEILAMIDRKGEN